MTVRRKVFAEYVWIPAKLGKLKGRQPSDADDLVFIQMSQKKDGDGQI
jgi:hypothetical protein